MKRAAMRLCWSQQNKIAEAGLELFHMTCILSNNLQYIKISLVLLMTFGIFVFLIFSCMTGCSS